jgi:hypothetical protein
MMVAGQSTVLWSRLHLIVNGKVGERILRWTLWMIIIDAIGFLIPTTVLAYGLNARLPGFASGYPAYVMSFKTDGGIDLADLGLLCRMEKVQVAGFL